MVLVRLAEWKFSRAFLPNKAQYFALGLAAAELDQKPGQTTARLYAAVLLAVPALCWAEAGPTKLAAPLVWTLALASERHGGPLAPVLRSRPLLWLGAISYPVYLVNEPAQKVVGTALSALFPGQPILFTALWVPLAIAVPMLIAWILHVHVRYRASAGANEPCRAEHRLSSTRVGCPGTCPTP